MKVKNLLHLYDIYQGQREGPLSEEMLQQLQAWGVIAKAGQYKCRYGHVLKLYKSKKYSDGWTWRCHKKFSIKRQKSKICRITKGIRKGTFFEKSKLSIFQILAFSYLWLENTELAFIRKQVEISNTTAVNFNKNCREICKFALAQNNINIDDELQKNEFRLHPRKKFYRGAYEKFVFLKWCKLHEKKSPFLEFMKFAGLLHNPLDPSSYAEYMSLLATNEEDKNTSGKGSDDEMSKEDSEI